MPKLFSFASSPSHILEYPATHKESSFGPPKQQQQQQPLLHYSEMSLLDMILTKKNHLQLFLLGHNTTTITNAISQVIGLQQLDPYPLSGISLGISVVFGLLFLGAQELKQLNSTASFEIGTKIECENESQKQKGAENEIE